jgi:uncharacterized protein (TIGR02996 family)
MLAVVVSHPGWAGPRRFAYPGPRIRIGTYQGNELILSDDGIAERHASVVLEDGALVFYENEIRIGTYVNERRIHGAQQLGAADQVRIGSYTLVFETVAVDTVDAHRPYVADHAMEESLLRAIAGRDEASRIVYADWLEQRGDRARAEFLRVQDQLRDGSRPSPELAVLVSRLRALAAEVDVAWRLRVADPGVARCVASSLFPCGMTWSALQATEHDRVRHCARCKQDVYYVLNVGEARAHAQRGRSVALDITSARWRGDLAEPFGARVCEQCKMDIGNARRDHGCPHCNHVVKREVAMGYVCSNVLGYQQLGDDSD